MDKNYGFHISSLIEISSAYDYNARNINTMKKIKSSCKIAHASAIIYSSMVCQNVICILYAIILQPPQLRVPTIMLRTFCIVIYTMMQLPSKLNVRSSCNLDLTLAAV